MRRGGRRGTLGEERRGLREGWRSMIGGEGRELRGEHEGREGGGGGGGGGSEASPGG